MSAPIYAYRVTVFVPMNPADEDQGTKVVVPVRAYNASDAILQAYVEVEGSYGVARSMGVMPQVLKVEPDPFVERFLLDRAKPEVEEA